jgi:hypothetical protein
MMLLGSFGLSTLAVGFQFLPYPYASSGLGHASEIFASPGELLWWTTLGGPFSGRPNDFRGYAVWILGSTVFWFIVAALGFAIAKGFHAAWKRWVH